MLRSIASPDHQKDSSSLATRVTRKSFLHCKIIRIAKRRDYGRSRDAIGARVNRSGVNVDPLEVAFRNSNIVARKDRNGCIERVCLFGTAAGSSQKNFVLVGAIRESTGTRDRVHHRET